MIGRTLAHYKILEGIGEGGMGIVYKAEDIKLNRPVALKFLSKEFTGSRKARERFKREAQAAAALNHPNIVVIYEIDEFKKQTFIAMEYVAGETLKEKIETRGLLLKDIIDIAIQCCEALIEAHKRKIIHRDIKPQNVILDKSNRVKIVDFGLAKFEGKQKITDKIVRIGTVNYMSPEQARGDEPDLRTDLWSLGVVLYEMVTGKRPFDGESEPEIIESILSKVPLPPTEIRSDLPAELEEIISRCLKKDRRDRYPGAQPLLDDLKELLKSAELKEEKQELKAAQKEKKAADRAAERRQATVMSAEISGHDEMLEELDAEEAAAIMNRCFDMLNVIVEKHGGGSGKIMGSSLTALFGVPKAIEDAPKRAVNAAIEMRSGLTRFNKENNLTTPLNIRIGINTGMVIAGAAYPLTGDTLSLASQFKELAPKGHIYAGQATYKYTGNEFDYKRLKPTILTGRTKFTTVFELLSTRGKLHRPELSPERMIYSDMVGREKELDKLKLHLLKVINGEGSLVSVIGEAGIGKSRLTAELKREKDIEKITLLEGRALATGKNLSYHPIIDILKNWAAIKDENSEEQSFVKLETAIANIDPRGVREVFPFVATMMGWKLTGDHERRVKGIAGGALEKLILKNVRELFIKISAAKPIVLLIEDLHWADISSIELLESLFRLTENHPALFINLFRPDYEETGERILRTTRERYNRIHAKICLQPLKEDECEKLIQNLVKTNELPKEIKTAITNRADGNPFFIEEVIRSFIDEGIVELKDGEFRVSKKIDSVVIPETIQDVLMARIDMLDETTKTILKEASVIGRFFFYKILAKVTESTKNPVDKLEYLKRIQLIRERTRFEEIEYLFKHALVQEVTYASILLRKRKELHLKVAGAIESVFPGKLHEFYGMLALHYSIGESVEKAEQYLIKAGEEAAKAAASSEALHYYQEALRIYINKYRDSGDSETIANLEWNIAKAFLNKGHMANAVEHFDKVLTLWGERRAKNKITIFFKFSYYLLLVIKNLYLPSRRAKLIPGKRDNDIFEATYQRGTALVFIDPNRVITDSIRALGTIHKYDLTRIPDGVAIYASASALFFFPTVSFTIARRLLDNARRYIEPDDTKTMFKYELWELMYDFLSGNWNRELQYNESVVDTILSEGNLFTTISHLVYSSGILTERGDFSAAQSYIDKLHEIGEVYESDYARHTKYLITARQLMKFRKLIEALADSEAGITITSRIGNNLDLLIFVGVKANIQLLQGEIVDAEETLHQADGLISQENQLTPWHTNSFYLARFLLNLNKLEHSIKSPGKQGIKQAGKEAFHSGKVAVRTADKLAPNRTETYKLMGVYYWLLGRQKRALKWWDKSIQIGEALGARPELARTYMEVGKRLLEKKSKYNCLKGIQAKEYLEKARVLFKGMNLDWDLNELDNIENQVDRGGR